jgi:hypothetical protein
LHEEALATLHRELAGLSMVPKPALDFTWHEVLRLIQADVPGNIVECGTWRGGCSFGMALVQRLVFGCVRRKVWMFDSFQGLPDASASDGQAAFAYQQNVNAPNYYNNCRADHAEVVADALRLGLSDDECRIVSGWFEASLPIERPILDREGIAFLRVDADWYAPVLYVLETLTPLVSQGGIILIDDYYTWDGCARAVHDHLSRHDLPWRIQSSPDSLTAFMVKPL